MHFRVLGLWLPDYTYMNIMMEKATYARTNVDKRLVNILRTKAMLSHYPVDFHNVLALFFICL